MRIFGNIYEEFVKSNDNQMKIVFALYIENPVEDLDINYFKLKYEQLTEFLNG